MRNSISKHFQQALRKIKLCNKIEGAGIQKNIVEIKKH